MRNITLVLVIPIVMVSQNEGLTNFLHPFSTNILAIVFFLFHQKLHLLLFYCIILFLSYCMHLLQKNFIAFARIEVKIRMRKNMEESMIIEKQAYQLVGM